jgi:hypothetical protein
MIVDVFAESNYFNDIEISAKNDARILAKLASGGIGREKEAWGGKGGAGTAAQVHGGRRDERNWDISRAGLCPGTHS